MGGGGGSLFSGISSIFTAIAPIIEIGLEVLKAVVSAIEAFAKELGIIEEDDNPEDLGDRALQSDMQPEEFDEYPEYLSYIKSFDLDPEKTLAFSEEEKLAAGALVIEKGIEDRTGLKMEDFMMDIATKNPEYYDSEKLTNYVEVFSEAGVDLDRVADLESGKITDLDEKEKIYALIEKANLA